MKYNLTDDSMIKVTDEVYYPAGSLVLVSATNVDFLKKMGLQNQRKRARLCAHTSPESSLHEMLIVHTKDTYVRPHKHIGKVESMYIIEGHAQYVTFDDSGNIENRIALGNYSSGKPCYCRTNDPVFHMLIIESDLFVFHEVTNGPFNPSDTVYAQWSPVADDYHSFKLYLKHIANQIN